MNNGDYAKYLAYVLATAILLIANTANAACTNKEDTFDNARESEPVSDIISTFTANGCYGEDQDNNPHTKKILELLSYDKSEKTPEELEALFLAVESDIQSELRKYTQGKSTESKFQETKDAWAAYEKAFNTIAIRKSGESQYWLVQQPNLSAFAYPKFEGRAFLEQMCPTLDISSNCSNAIAETVQLIRAFNLLATITETSLLPNAITHLNDTKLRLQQWDDYFNKAEPLWFTELGLNSILEMKGTRFDDNGNLIGFRDVPDKQHLFLHPTTALQYFEEEDSDSNFKPAILLDLYGINFLDWNKTTRRLDGSMGASLTISYSNHEDSDDYGWGIRIFNNKNWSFGITKHSERVGIFLSIGVVEQISDWKKKVSEWETEQESWKEELGIK